MKRVLLLILVIATVKSMAQHDSTWKGYIIDPDIYVSFPAPPQSTVTKTVKAYEFKDDEVILKVTSEKSPLNYTGRTMKEVNAEYYGSLTAKTIPNKKVLGEEDFKFENHNVRRLVYLDTIDTKPCIVTLEILNVTGYEEAMYKFYLIDFKERNTIPQKYRPFFSGWDLNYKLENKLNNNVGGEEEVLKKSGFKKGVPRKIKRKS